MKRLYSSRDLPSRQSNASTGPSAPASYQEEEGTITFDAISLGHASKEQSFVTSNHSHYSYLRFLPLSIDKLVRDGPSQVLLADKETCPVFSVPTADGVTIQLNATSSQTGETKANSKRKIVAFNRLTDRVQRNAGIISNNHVIVAKIFWPGSGPSSVNVPPAGSVVRVINMGLKTYNGKTGLVFSGLDASVHSALNRLPHSTRMRAIWPMAAQFGMPDIHGLMPYKQLAKNALGTANMSEKERQKELEIQVQAAGCPPVPVTCLSVVQKWSLNTPSDGKVSAAEALLCIPSVSDDDKDPVVAAYIKSVVGSGSGTVYLPKADDKSSAKLSLKFCLSVEQTDKRDPTKQLVYSILDLIIYADRMCQLGLAYPPYLDALLRHNPIPFDVILSPNVAKTVRIADNEPVVSDRENAYCDGVIVPDVYHIEWRTVEYLVRRGVPVTKDFLLARYGSKDNVIRPVSHPDYDALTSQLGLVNPFNQSGDKLRAAYERYRMTSLDEGLHELSDNSLGPLYFALPGEELDCDIPMAHRADPFSTESAEDLPLAVNLTPEEGDKFIIECFGRKPPTGPESWFKNKVPRWFFFEVFTAHNAITPALPKLPVRPGPVSPSSPSSTLPRDMDDFRIRDAREFFGIVDDSPDDPMQTDNASDEPVASTQVTAPPAQHFSEEEMYDEDQDDAEEPPHKKRRV